MVSALGEIIDGGAIHPEEKSRGKKGLGVGTSDVVWRALDVCLR